MEFNIDFHQPKNDRCDICKAFKAVAHTLSAENEQAVHVAAKLAA